jgi:excinuclease ABC subunit A
MFKGQTIADVLNMSCEEALAFFANQPTIARHLQTLVDVGLGYIRLGQPAPTLSGGEAQRVKLSSELSRRPTGQTLYVLDEPTTGLHFDDVRKLLEVLSRLVDQGNTVIVIEHNLDVIKTADWIVDLGPEGGERGGDVVAEGTPEEVAAVPTSYTGQVLVPVLASAGRLPVTRKARPGKAPVRRGRPAATAPAATRSAKVPATRVGAGKVPAAKVPATRARTAKVSAAKVSAAKVPATRAGAGKVPVTRGLASKRARTTKVSAAKVQKAKVTSVVKTARATVARRKASVT